MIEHRNEIDVTPFYLSAFQKRHEEELYDLKNDPAQLINVAYYPEYSSIKATLKSEMETYCS